MQIGLSQREDFWYRPSSDICPFFSYNNLMLFAWAGFISAVWTFSFFANENHLNTSERESSERSWKRKCVLECVCVVIFFGRNIKNHGRAIRQLVLFASYLTQTVYTLTTSHRAQNTITQNAANHSSIFYARMHKTLASLCKLQLMWEGEKAEGARWECKSGKEEWAGADTNRQQEEK